MKILYATMNIKRYFLLLAQSELQLLAYNYDLYITLLCWRNKLNCLIMKSRPILMYLNEDDKDYVYYLIMRISLIFHCRTNLFT